MADGEVVRAQLGAVFTNLQSLEFALRVFLSESVGPQDTSFHIHELDAGDVVAESYMTNFDSLRAIIRKANSQICELGFTERVDVRASQTYATRWLTAVSSHSTLMDHTGL